ncbi:MAG: hypothetical protein QOH25_987 [Acidobacteriota bacterium]|nr:hypothetical protein [Acidobacteriota bacterium]
MCDPFRVEIFSPSVPGAAQATLACPRLLSVTLSGSKLADDRTELSKIIIAGLLSLIPPRQEPATFQISRKRKHISSRRKCTEFARMPTFTPGMETFTPGMTTFVIGMPTFTPRMETFTAGKPVFTLGMETLTVRMEVYAVGMTTFACGTETFAPGMRALTTWILSTHLRGFA